MTTLLIIFLIFVFLMSLGGVIGKVYRSRREFLLLANGILFDIINCDRCKLIGRLVRLRII